MVPSTRPKRHPTRLPVRLPETCSTTRSGRCSWCPCQSGQTYIRRRHLAFVRLERVPGWIFPLKYSWSMGVMTSEVANLSAPHEVERWKKAKGDLIRILFARYSAKCDTHHRTDRNLKSSPSRQLPYSTSGWFSFSLSVTCTSHTAFTTSPGNSRNCWYRGRYNRYCAQEMYAIERHTSTCVLSRRT